MAPRSGSPAAAGRARSAAPPPSPGLGRTFSHLLPRGFGRRAALRGSVHGRARPAPRQGAACGLCPTAAAAVSSSWSSGGLCSAVRIRNPSGGRAVVTQGRGQPLAGVFAAAIAGVHTTPDQEEGPSCPVSSTHCLPCPLQPPPAHQSTCAAQGLPARCEASGLPRQLLAWHRSVSSAEPFPPNTGGPATFISQTAGGRGCPYTACPATLVPRLPAAAEHEHGVCEQVLPSTSMRELGLATRARFGLSLMSRKTNSHVLGGLQEKFV